MSDRQARKAIPAPDGCCGRAGASSRRDFLRLASNGFGLTAFSALAGRASGAGRPQHFPATADNVIFLFMPGGVSHMESFDPKPKLAELDGKPAVLDSYVAGPNRKWLRGLWEFQRHGECGAPVSSLFPHIAQHVDELAIIRSMHSPFPLHARGNIFLHTGRLVGGFPSMGSWAVYGLGSENENLPGYILLRDVYVPPGGIENFSNGFLPATYQATHIRNEGTPIDNLERADASDAIQRAKIDAMIEQDRGFLESREENAQVEAAIASFEMAYRMQSLAPDVLDLSQESEATQRLYGIDSDNDAKRSYGMQCLRARRLIEEGVRFVEVTCPNLFGMNGTWDQHSDLKNGHETNALVTDQAVAGLLTDLKSRGMLERTLVVWAGEFGRTPDTGNGDGRDHHPACFTIWLAGGGARGGVTHGETDELGNEVVRDPVSIHDLHATILRALGVDHERLTYRFGGREHRLTDVHGRAVTEVLG